VYRVNVLLPLVVLGLAVASEATADVRTGLVYKTGEIRVIEGAPGARTENDGSACDDPDLLFRFTESVSQSELRLESGVREQGEIEVHVRIDLACDAGTATFDYGHEMSSSFPDADVLISPLAPSLNLSLQAGASGTATVGYQLLDPRVRRARTELFGERITFIVGQVFGRAGDRRTLASIEFLGDVVDEDILGSTDVLRLRDAGLALNEACRRAEPGSLFDRTCNEIREFAITDEQQLQVINAFDAHGLAAMPQAADQLGQIQQRNLRERLNQLRSGGPNVSVSGLSLSFNGQRFDQGWLPASLQMNEDENGSRLLADRWGAFVNGDISIGSRSERGKEVSFDFDSWGLTAGVDYRFRNGSIAGLAVGYSKYDADIDHDGGSLDGDTYSVQFFGTLDLAADLYMDLTAGYSKTDFDQRRVVDLSGIGSLSREVAAGSTRSEQYSGSASLNYRFRLDNGMTITPYGQLFLADVSIDGFSESGSVFAFDYPDQSFTSTLWSAGIRGSRAFSRERSIVSPYMDLSVQHQSGIDSYSVQPTLAGTDIFGPVVEISDPDRTFGRLDAGVSWVFPTGSQMFVSYSAMLFERHTTQHTFFIGGRLEF
jgi:outer membrane autotransporter protein